MSFRHALHRSLRAGGAAENAPWSHGIGHGGSIVSKAQSFSSIAACAPVASCTGSLGASVSSSIIGFGAQPMVPGARGTTALAVRFQSSSPSKPPDTLKDSYDNILVDVDSAPGVAVIKLNRPKQLNALSDAVLDDLIHATYVLQQHRDDVGCLVIASSTSKAFAAGADISEMSNRGYEYCYKNDMFANWQLVTSNGPKPVLAAVSGYCLGGGCELMMQCDVAYCTANAKFGQPEINLGILPGAGGTQRLTRAVGKAKAMHYCLTGEFFTAADAEAAGLVAKVYEDHEAMLKDVVHNIASTIANKKGRLAVQAVKEAVNAADELSLSQGLRLERRLFHGLFATRDQKEGMDAFLNKRDAEFVKYQDEK